MATTTTDRLRFAASTHPGLARAGNEDNFAATPHLFAIADGMGGHAAGEVASEIAINVIRQRLADGAATVGIVVAATIEANASIFYTSHSSPHQRGMGTTLTAISVLHADHPDHPEYTKLAVVNVGDSRTYVLRAGELHRLTVDHSYVQELLATGHITEAEGRTHPRRNIVTRALGIEPTVRVDAWIVHALAGDRYLLCSDGLVDEVDDMQLAQLLAAHDDPQTCADQLIEAANAAGGRDNTTVIVMDTLIGVAPPEDLEPVDAELPDWTGEVAPRPTDEPTQEIPVIPGSGTPVTPAHGVPVTAGPLTAGAPGTLPTAATTTPATGAAPTSTPNVIRRKQRNTAAKAILGALLAIIAIGAMIVGFVLNRDDSTPTPTTVATTIAPTTSVATTLPATTLPATTLPTTVSSTSPGALTPRPPLSAPAGAHASTTVPEGP